MTEGGGITVGELPIRKNVEEIRLETSDFDICDPVLHTVSRKPFFKKYHLIHRVEDEGDTYWDIVTYDRGEFEHHKYGIESEEE